MTHIAPHCTPATRETFDRALRQFCYTHEHPIDQLSRAMLTANFFKDLSDQNINATAKEFKEKYICCVNDSIPIFFGDTFIKGNYKEIKGGLLPTRDKVLQVAFVITRLTKKRPGKIDWNENEYEFLKKHIQNSIPGCIEVLLIKIFKQEETDTLPQFIFVFQRSHCDLSYFIKNNYPSLLPPWQIRNMQFTVMQYLSNLHKLGLLHRDMKPDNILVKIDDKKTKQIPESIEMRKNLFAHPETKIELRICDFTFSGPCEDDKMKDRQPGSFAYLSPEACDWMLDPSKWTEGPSKATDIWSLGLILLYLEDPTLFFEIVPLNEVPQSKTLFLDRYKFYFQRKTIPQFPEPAKNTMKHLIWRMLRPRPEERISLPEALQAFERIEALPSPPKQSPGDPLEEIAQLFR